MQSFCIVTNTCFVRTSVTPPLSSELPSCCATLEKAAIQSSVVTIFETLPFEMRHWALAPISLWFRVVLPWICRLMLAACTLYPRFAHMGRGGTPSTVQPISRCHCCPLLSNVGNSSTAWRAWESVGGQNAYRSVYLSASLETATFIPSEAVISKMNYWKANTILQSHPSSYLASLNQIKVPKWYTLTATPKLTCFAMTSSKYWRPVRANMLGRTFSICTKSRHSSGDTSSITYQKTNNFYRIVDSPVH